jgi:hypothetical protein
MKKKNVLYFGIFKVWSVYLFIITSPSEAAVSFETLDHLIYCSWDDQNLNISLLKSRF